MSTDIEREIIKGLLKSKDFTLYVLDVNMPNYFIQNEIYKWCYKTVLDYYVSSGNIIDKNGLLLKLSKIENVDTRLYTETINNLYKEDIPSLEILKQEFLEYYKKQKFIIALSKSVNILQNTEDVGEAEKHLIQYFFTDNVVRDKGFEIIDWLENWEKRKEQRVLENSDEDLKRKRIRTGYYKLDEILGGLYSGEVLSVAGLTGRGKSIFVLNIGANVYLDNFNVLHITTENPNWQTLGRYDARILDLPYKELQLNKLSKNAKEQAEMTINELRKTLTAKLKVIELPPNNFSILTIRNYMHRLSITENFEPDLVILDSPDLMNSITQFKEYRLQKSAVYWEFKGLVIEKGISGVVTTQAKVTTIKAPTSEDLAEAYDKARLLDKIIGIFSDAEDKIKGVMSVYIAKNRDGESDKTIKLPVDFTKISIYNEV